MQSVKPTDMSKSESKLQLLYHIQKLIKEYNAIETPMKQKIEINVTEKKLMSAAYFILEKNIKVHFFVIEPLNNQNSLHSQPELPVPKQVSVDDVHENSNHASTNSISWNPNLNDENTQGSLSLINKLNSLGFIVLT